MLHRISVAVAVLSIGIGSVAAQDLLPDGEGRDIVEYACSQCHDLLRVTQASKTEQQWQFLVTQMLNQGAPIEDYEVETVVRYLTEHFGN